MCSISDRVRFMLRPYPHQARTWQKLRPLHKTTQLQNPGNSWHFKFSSVSSGIWIKNIYDTNMAVFVNESCAISKILSQTGYCKYMRTARQNAFKCLETSVNRNSLCKVGFSGSKAEGLSAICENDIDSMLVPTYTVCSEYPMEYCTGEQKHNFRLSKQCTAPGYAILQLLNICETLPGADFITHCLVELLPEKLYISSDIWKHTFKQVYREFCLEPDWLGLVNTYNENHGPSTVIELYPMNWDNVSAMICYCPSYLYSWMIRERHHNWPTADVIEEVSELESHVVPVGNINSPLQYMEWRICYTKGEITLVRSLPECLMKVYVLMKAIVKVTLKPICKEISSYIIKNIVLWIAELHPSECFSEKNLITILQQAFKFLKTFLAENNLPSYMIPDRNLFADRLTLQQRSRLCMRIDCLLREGPRVVYRVKKMRDALNMLYRSPEEFQSYSKRRQIIEVLVLMLVVYATDKFLDEDIDTERCLRKAFTDDFVVRMVLYLCRLDPEMADTVGERNGDAVQTIDPIEYALRFIRGDDGDFLIRNNFIFKCLG